MGKETKKLYRPSNGSEGDWFINKYCNNCIHGKYEHTGDIQDKPCDILSSSFCYGIEDEKYPKEWQYDENNKPCCTNYSKWDWNQDDDGNWNDPPITDPPDPNQMCLPFIIEEIEINTLQPQLV